MDFSSGARPKSWLRTERVYRPRAHSSTVSPRHQKAAPLTALVSQATEFVRRSEQELLDGKVESQRMAWVYETYITEDTELLTAKMDAAAIAAALRIAKESRRYSKVSGPPVLKRKLELLRLTQTVMTPSNPAEGDELTRLARVDAKCVRTRKVSTQREGRTARYQRPFTHHGAQSRSGRVASRVGRLACHRAPDAARIRALRRTR